MLKIVLFLIITFILVELISFAILLKKHLINDYKKQFPKPILFSSFLYKDSFKYRIIFMFLVIAVFCINQSVNYGTYYDRYGNKYHNKTKVVFYDKKGNKYTLKNDELFLYDENNKKTDKKSIDENGFVVDVDDEDIYVSNISGISYTKDSNNKVSYYYYADSVYWDENSKMIYKDSVNDFPIKDTDKYIDV